MSKLKYVFQKKILAETQTKPILYLVALAKLLHSATAGVFLSQILYWDKRGRNHSMFYKTVNEFKEETGLTKYQQLSAQKKCEKLGIIKVEYHGIPRKRNYIVDEERLLKLIEDMTK